MLKKVSDVAKELSISESLVYALAESGKLTGYRVGIGRDLEVY